MIEIGELWETGGRLTIDGVLMHVRGAWNVRDVRELWLPAAVRGEDTIVGHAPGALGNKRRATATDVALDFDIGGFCDHVTGDEVGDDRELQMAQFERNMDYLVANVLTQPNTATSERVASLQRLSGIRVANVHVLGITPTRWGSVSFSGTLDLTITPGTLS